VTQRRTTIHTTIQITLTEEKWTQLTTYKNKNALQQQQEQQQQQKKAICNLRKREQTTTPPSLAQLCRPAAAEWPALSCRDDTVSAA